MIHYYHGDGKGKTTAAMGLALRAVGRGKRVFIVQFLKDMPSGEVMFFENVPGVTLCRGRAGHRFASSLSAPEREQTANIHNGNLRRGMTAVQRGECDLLVLDEVGDAYGHSLLDGPALLAFLGGYGQQVEVVMTGHKPVAELIALADYVTLVRKEKHPFDKGVTARVGVEF